MTFKFPCPHCGQRIAATSEDCGDEAVCTTCEKSFIVPAAPADELPPPIPEAPERTNPRRGTPKRLRTALVFLLLGLLLAGSVAGILLWKHRSPAVVTRAMFEAFLRQDPKALAGLVTSESRPHLQELEEEIEETKKSATAMEAMKRATVEVEGTEIHGNHARVRMLVSNPDRPETRSSKPQLYARKTWLGWKVDLVTGERIRKDLVNAKQIQMSIRMYEHDNKGRKPKDLTELVPRYLDDVKGLRSPLAPDSVEVGYEYFGGNNGESKSTDRLLQGKVRAFDGTRVVIYRDGRTVRE